jgi:hypothetical protein
MQHKQGQEHEARERLLDKVAQCADLLTKAAEEGITFAGTESSSGSHKVIDKAALRRLYGSH